MLLQIPFLELLYLHRLVNCSCRCFFLLICKNIHPQLVFSLLADTLLQKFASANCLFSILQILPCKNLHPQLAFSLSCRYSPSKICIHNLLLLYLSDTPHSSIKLLWIFTELKQKKPRQFTLAETSMERATGIEPAL